MTRRRAELAVLVIAALWGLSFVLVKDAVAGMAPLTFLAWRFVPAAALLAVWSRRSLRTFTGWDAALVLGTLQAASFLMLTLGLQSTTAARAGFLTGAYVVLTPVLGLAFARHRTPAATWAAAGASAVGLLLLSGGGGGNALGDALVLASAAAIAAHVLVTARVAGDHDVAALVAAQLAIAGALFAVPALVLEGPGMPSTQSEWLAIAVTSILCTAVAFVIQTGAQRHVAPSRTAVLLACEPVFGALFAVLLAHESLTPQSLAGGLMIVLAAATAAGTGPMPGRPAGLRRARRTLR